MVLAWILFHHVFSYYGVWFVVDLLQRRVIRRLVTAFYLCEGNSDK